MNKYDEKTIITLPATGATNLKGIASETVFTLRNRIGGNLHDAILREMLVKECENFPSLKDQTAAQWIARLS